MTDNEIIKALECCITNRCDECPIYKECHATEKGRVDIVLDLINRQKAEIEKKNTEIDILIRKKGTLRDEISELKAEVERLKDIAKSALNESIKVCDFILDAKSEAIKEFAERLKEKACSHNCRYFGNVYDIKAVEVKDIDNLVKEMVGDEGGEGK